MNHRDHEGRRDYRSGQRWAQEQEQERDRTESSYDRGGRSPYEDQSAYSARVPQQGQGYERGRGEYYGSRQFSERGQGAGRNEESGSERGSWEYEGGPERLSASSYGEEQQERWDRDFGSRQRGQWVGGQREQGNYGSGTGDYYSDRQRYGERGQGTGVRAQQGGSRNVYGSSRGSEYGTRSVYGGESAGYGGRGLLHGGLYTEEGAMAGYRGEEIPWAGSPYSTEQGRRAYGSSGMGHSFRGVGPKNYRRSDERLTEDINERLTDDDDLDASEITVRVLEGKVTLEGTVDQRWMKHRAEDIADACIGVKEVDNRIMVTSPSSELRDREMGRASRTSTMTGSAATGGTAPEIRGSTPH